MKRGTFSKPMKKGGLSWTVEGCAAAMTGTLTPVLHSHASHEHLPPQLRIANTAAVLDGPYGAVTRQAALCRHFPPGTLPRRSQSASGRRWLRHASGVSTPSRTTSTASAPNATRSSANSSRPWSSMPTASPASRPRPRPKASACPSPDACCSPSSASRPPASPQLGRWTHAAAQQAAALLPVLDDGARPRVEQVAADEIFFGRRPCLMVVEQHSLCWLTGRLADNRNGDTWAEEFRRLPNLQQVTRDGGTGLAKGVAQVNQERQAQGQAPLADQEDHFHTLREGRRALRQVQQRVCRCIDAAAAAHHREQQKARRTGSRQGTATVTAQAERHAAAAVEAGAAVEEAWASIARRLAVVHADGGVEYPGTGRGDHRGGVADVGRARNGPRRDGPWRGRSC